MSNTESLGQKLLRGQRAALWIGDSPPWLQFVVITVVTFLLGQASLFLNQYSGNVTVIWLPNAFAVSLLFLLQRSHYPINLAAHWLGVFASNLMIGNAVWISVAFGVVNSGEVILVLLLLDRFHGRTPIYASEYGILKFLALVCIPSATITAVFGSFLLKIAYDMEFLDAFGAWVIGDAASLFAFIPVFRYVLGRGQRPYDLYKNQVVTIGLLTALILTCLLLGAFLKVQLIAFMALLAFVPIAALRLGRAGAMWTTAFLVPIISVTGYVERGFLENQGVLNLGKEVYAFAFVFLCIALPLNLIATLVERLRVAENTQRDIAKMKNDFISTMSHEIKTPMNAIHGMFELFNMSDLTERQRKWASAGLSASRNLQQQVTQILDLASLQDYAVQINHAPVEIRTMAQDWSVALEAQAVAQGKALEITCLVEDDVPQHAQIDRVHVQQIMNNLLNNAVKFSNEGGIRVLVEKSGRQLLFRVRDTGIGIASEHREAIFQRFWQVDHGDSRKHGGSGLGLSISLELAKVMGGTINVASHLGEGTEFILSLPYVPVTRPETGGINE